MKAPSSNEPAAPAEKTRARGRLFRKYVGLFLAVVCVALLTNGLSEIWFSYQEHKAALIRSAGTIDQRRFDGLRLLRQVPAITELSQLDSTGKEQLRVSRLAMDVVASQADLSKEPKFAEEVAHKVYYGPVFFRRVS